MRGLADAAVAESDESIAPAPDVFAPLDRIAFVDVPWFGMIHPLASLRSFAVALPLATILIACTAKDRAPPPVQPPAAAATPPGVDPWQVCEVDSDCVLVDTSCCWYCQSVYGVATNHAARARADHAKASCEDQVCVDLPLGCVAATPLCVKHMCGYRAAVLGGAEMFPRLPQH